VPGIADWLISVATEPLPAEMATDGEDNLVHNSEVLVRVMAVESGDKE